MKSLETEKALSKSLEEQNAFYQNEIRRLQANQNISIDNNSNIKSDTNSYAIETLKAKCNEKMAES